MDKGLIFGCTLRDTVAIGGLGVLEQLIKSKKNMKEAKIFKERSLSIILRVLFNLGKGCFTFQHMITTFEKYVRILTTIKLIYSHNSRVTDY